MVSEIELEIGPGATPTEFTTRVIHAAAGGEPAALMQLDVERHLRDRDRLENTVLASAVPSRRVLPVGEQYLRGVGQELFDALFVGPVYGAYRASLGAAQREGERLRVVLRLTAPALAALPWEALWDKETERYLCRSEPLVRHVPAPFTPDPLEVVPPLKVLGLVASPRGMPALDVPAEQDRLAQALAGPVQQRLITLEWLVDATWADVHSRLLSEEWHVLHFIGHGDYDVDSDQGLIALMGADGRADLIEAERLADLFGEAQPAPRLVVLNSCSGGESGTQDLFSGTAAALVRSGICAVAAMQFTVSDDAAIAFARGFYAAIAAGRGVDEATRSGRIAILGARHTLEWVTPVLYVRGETTHLFTVTPVVPGDDPALPDLEGSGADAPEPDAPGPALHGGSDVQDVVVPEIEVTHDEAPLAKERRDRTATLRLLSAGAVGAALVLLVATVSSVHDVIDVSRPTLSGSVFWVDVAWLLPCVPLAGALWLMLRRRGSAGSAGVALGCLEAAAVWVWITWVLVGDRVAADSRGPAPGIQLLLLILLAAAIVAHLAAQGRRERMRLNAPGRALLAAALVAAAILLRLVNQQLAQLVISDGPPPDALHAATVWISVLVPLLVGVPAVLLRLPDLHRSALMALAVIQIGFEVVIRVGTVIVVDPPSRRVLGSVIYVLGTACLLLAVVVGQRRSRAEPVTNVPVQTRRRAWQGRSAGSSS